MTRAMTQRRERTRRRRGPVAAVTSTIPITIDGFGREIIRQIQVQGYDVCVVSSPGPELPHPLDAFSTFLSDECMAELLCLFADRPSVLRASHGANSRRGHRVLRKKQTRTSLKERKECTRTQLVSIQLRHLSSRFVVCKATVKVGI